MEEERPRFRRDLDTSPVEVDGVAYVDATDPRSGKTFRFYQFEHAAAEVLDGRPLSERALLTDARARTGHLVTTAQLVIFAEKLRELGFLEAGDEDATAAGPAPAEMLDSAPTAPQSSDVEEPVEEAAIPPGSTERLPILDSIGSTEKLPTLEQPAYDGPPVKEPPAQQPPAQEPPQPEPPAEEPPPPATSEPSPVQEPPAEQAPVKEPAASAAAEPADPELSPRAGELMSPRPPSPTEEMELAPPAEGHVVAAELDEEEAALAALPGSEDPTKSERRDDLIGESRDPAREDLRGTLHGLPFKGAEEVAARTEPAPFGPEPRATPPAPPAPPPAVAGPVPASPFPPAVSLMEDAPFPRAATPAPVVPFPPAVPTKELIPLAVTAEVKPLAKTAEVEPLGDSVELKPLAQQSARLELLGDKPSTPKDLVKTVETPAFTESTEVHARAGSAEVPALVAPTPRPSSRRLSPALFAGAGVVLAATIGFFFYRLSATSEQGPLAVRTIVPTAGLTYRWFDATGTVKGGGGEHTLNFTGGGKVSMVLGAGASFHPGDVIAELEGSGAPQNRQALEHNKQRLAYYEQRLQQMTQAGNRPEIRQAELKIAEKKRLIAEAGGGETKQGLVATSSGEVAAALVTPGTVVKAGAPAVRTKGKELRAEFELSREDANAIRHLGFCKIEVGGKPFDCSLSAEGGDETHVLLDVPADPEIAAGKPVRLAKARYDGAFVLPATALAPTKGSDRRVYVVKDGRAESYAVILADQTPTEIVITQGLEPNSAVIAEVPPTLKPRAPVKATPLK
jgi:hypothetical protein